MAHFLSSHVVVFIIARTCYMNLHVMTLCMQGSESPVSDHPGQILTDLRRCGDHSRSCCAVLHPTVAVMHP